jgi:hypothetical protein
MLDPLRQVKMVEALMRIAAEPALSSDIIELVTKSLP